MAVEYKVLKRKEQLCYYVMKLAEYGEIYSFVEHTERFDEPMTRYIFNQLIEGIHYLHSNGIVHRDIKPENLLINKKGKVIIADFSFATRMAEIETDGMDLFTKKFDPIIERRHNVGSENYNAPEIWDNDITVHEFEQKLKVQDDKGVFEYSDLDGQLRKLSCFPQYDGVKSDVFSIGASLFMIHMQSPPFRKAVVTDPYYKRLASSMKAQFWKIFKNV